MLNKDYYSIIYTTIYYHHLHESLLMNGQQKYNTEKYIPMQQNTTRGRVREYGGEWHHGVRILQIIHMTAKGCVLFYNEYVREIQIFHK